MLHVLVSLVLTSSEPEKKVYDGDGVFRGLSDSVSNTDSNTAGEGHGDGHDSKTEQLDGSSSSRPSVGSMRRRSTLSWGNVAPDVRQKKLEEVTGSRLADVFFTIFDIEGEELIYVSETIEKTMNPDFRSFDNTGLKASLGRSSELQIDLWAKPECLDEPQHLVRMKVNLTSLRWVCKSMVRNYPIRDPNFKSLPSNQLRLEEPLPPNCILFHLPDGIYTHISSSNFSDFMPLVPSRPFIHHKRVPLQELFAACYDGLSRLNLISDCIDDALFVRYEILTSIERLLKAQDPSSQILSITATEKQSLEATYAALNECKRSIAAEKAKTDGIDVGNSTRRSRMGEGRAFINKIAERQYAELAELDHKTSTKETQTQETRGHIRRVAQILSTVFPITPIEDRPLCFEICGQYLPNADDLFATGKHAPTEQGIAAALGYVASLMTQLADNIGFYYPYPINYLGSNSSIEDPITVVPSSSTANPKRVFPLNPTGTKRADFEYAVYLLNQDLMGLMALECMRVVNPKTTLANLKYLMEVLTSGKGDVPPRKKGKNMLEAVGLSKVNVGGTIIKEGSGPAEERVLKDGGTLMDVLMEQYEMSGPRALAELEAAHAAGAGDVAGAVKVQDATTAKGKGKAKAKGNAKGKGKEKEKEKEPLRPYTAPTVEDEAGSTMEGPASAGISMSSSN